LKKLLLCLYDHRTSRLVTENSHNLTINPLAAKGFVWGEGGGGVLIRNFEMNLSRGPTILCIDMEKYRYMYKLKRTHTSLDHSSFNGKI